MKKTIGVIAAFLVVLTLVFIGCNNPTGDGTEEGGKEITGGSDNLYPFSEGDNYRGTQITLSTLIPNTTFLDISKYASVTIHTTFFSDQDGTTEILTNQWEATGMAQFMFLIGSGNWENESNRCTSPQSNMKRDINTMYINEASSGTPAFLLIETNKPIIQSVKVTSITFTPRGEGETVILSWGTPGAKTELFPSDTQWPGKSLPLSGATITGGPLNDITNYKEVIVEATVYNRNNEILLTQSPGPAFFTLTTAEGQWQTTEIVKQYDMIINGDTSVTPATNKRTVNDEPTWGPGIPTHIVFQGRFLKSGDTDYNANNWNNNTMVGYVEVRKLTFVPY